MQNYAEENLELQERLLELQKRYDTDVSALQKHNAELEAQIARMKSEPRLPPKITINHGGSFPGMGMT